MSDWSVLVFGTFSATVTVTAETAEEASKAAIEGCRVGDLHPDYEYSGWDTDEPEQDGENR